MKAYDEILSSASALSASLIKKANSPVDAKTIANNIDEAEAFLEECMAVVVDSIDEVWEYFDEEGFDLEGEDKQAIADAPEVFDIGDGRYLIVES